MSRYIQFSATISKKLPNFPLCPPLFTTRISILGLNFQLFCEKYSFSVLSKITASRLVLLCEVFCRQIPATSVARQKYRNFSWRGFLRFCCFICWTWFIFLFKCCAATKNSLGTTGLQWTCLRARKRAKPPGKLFFFYFRDTSRVARGASGPTHTEVTP